MDVDFFDEVLAPIQNHLGSRPKSAARKQEEIHFIRVGPADADADPGSLKNLCLDYFAKALVSVRGDTDKWALCSERDKLRQSLALEDDVRERLAASLHQISEWSTSSGLGLLPEEVYRRGLDVIEVAWPIAFQSAAIRQSCFESWLRLCCPRSASQLHRAPKLPALTLVDFTGDHWSRLAFDHLASLPDNSAPAVKELRLSCHPKNTSPDTNETQWKWLLKKLLRALPGLETVFLGDFVDDDVMCYVADLPRLRRLRLSGRTSYLTDEGFLDFAEYLKSEQLEELDMTDLEMTSVFGQLLNGIFKSIFEIKSLKKLGLHFDILESERRHTNTGQELPSFAGNIELSLGFFKVHELTDRTLEALTIFFPAVVNLSLLHFPMGSLALLDKDRWPLGEKVKLCTLAGEVSTFQGAGIIEKTFPSLRELHLSEPSSGFLIQTQMVNLTHFVLVHNFFTVGIDVIQKVLLLCPNLTLLRVHGDPVGQQDVSEECEDAAMADCIRKLQEPPLESFEVACACHQCPLGLKTLKSLTSRCHRLKKVGILNSWRPLLGETMESLSAACEVALSTYVC